MSRKVLPILLIAAVVVYPAGFLETFDNPSRDTGPCWSGETHDSVLGVSSPEAPKASAWAPVSAATAPPSEAPLHQRPFLEEWEPASHFGVSGRLGRSPPLA